MSQRRVDPLMSTGHMRSPSPMRKLNSIRHPSPSVRLRHASPMRVPANNIRSTPSSPRKDASISETSKYLRERLVPKSSRPNDRAIPPSLRPSAAEKRDPPPSNYSSSSESGISHRSYIDLLKSNELKSTTLKNSSTSEISAPPSPSTKSPRKSYSEAKDSYKPSTPSASSSTFKNASPSTYNTYKRSPSPLVNSIRSGDFSSFKKPDAPTRNISSDLEKILDKERIPTGKPLPPIKNRTVDGTSTKAASTTLQEQMKKSISVEEEVSTVTSKYVKTNHVEVKKRSNTATKFSFHSEGSAEKDKKKIAELADVIDHTKKSYTQLAKTTDETTKRNNQLEAELNELRHWKETMSTSNTSSNTSSQEEVKALKRQIMELENKLANEQTRNIEQTKLLNKKDAVIQDMSKNCTEVDQLRKTIHSLSQEKSKKDANEQKIDELTDVIKHTKKSYTQLARTSDIMNMRNAELETQVEDLKKISKLKFDQEAELSELKQENNKLKAIVAQRENDNERVLKESDEKIALMEKQNNELTQTLERVKHNHIQLTKSSEMVTMHSAELETELQETKQSHAAVLEANELLAERGKLALESKEKLETQLQEKNKVELELRAKLESASKAVKELRDAGVKRGKQISALLKEKGTNQSIIADLQSSKEKESFELQSSLEQVREHFKMVETQYIEKLVDMQKKFEELKEENLSEQTVMKKREIDLDSDLNEMKALLIEKNSDILSLQRENKDLLDEINEITKSKEELELCNAKVQGNLDEAMKNQNELNEDISNLQIQNEQYLNQLSDTKVAHDQIVLQLESLKNEHSAAVSNFEANIEDFKKHLDEKTEEVECLQLELASLERSNMELQNSFQEEKMTMRNKYDQATTNLHRDVETVKTELNSCKKEKDFKIQALSAELDILREAYTKTRSGLKQKLASASTLLSEKSVLEAENKKLEHDFAMQSNELEETHATMEKLESLLLEKEAELTRVSSTMKQQYAEFVVSLENEQEKKDCLNSKLQLEREQLEISNISTSVLEACLTDLHAILKVISKSKALFLDGEQSDQEENDEDATPEDLSFAIASMLDDRNIMIKQLLEELDTMKVIYDQQIKEKESRITEFEEHLNLAQLNIESLNSKTLDLSSSLERAHFVLNEKETVVQNSSDHINELQTKLDTSLMQLDSNSNEMSKLEEELNKKEATITKTDESLKQANHNVESLENKISNLTSSLEMAKDSLSQKDKNLADLQRRFDAALSESKSLTEKVIDLTHSLDSVVQMNEEERCEFERSISEYESMLAQMGKDVRESNAKLEETEKENAELLEEIEKLNESMSLHVKSFEEETITSKSQLTKLEEEAAKMKRKLQSRIEEQEAELADKGNELDILLEEQSKDKLKIDELIDEHKVALQIKEKEMTDLEEIIFEKGLHIGDLTNQIEELEKRNNKHISSLEGELLNSQNQILALENGQQRKELELEAAVKEISEKQGYISKLKDQKRTLQDNLDKAYVLQEQLELRLEHVMEESTKTKQALQQVTKEYSKAKQQFQESAAKQKQAQDDAMQSIMAELMTASDSILGTTEKNASGSLTSTESNFTFSAFDDLIAAELRKANNPANTQLAIKEIGITDKRAVEEISLENKNLSTSVEEEPVEENFTSAEMQKSVAHNSEGPEVNESVNEVLNSRTLAEMFPSEVPKVSNEEGDHFDTSATKSTAELMVQLLANKNGNESSEEESGKLTPMYTQPMNENMVMSKHFVSHSVKVETTTEVANQKYISPKNVFDTDDFDNVGGGLIRTHVSPSAMKEESTENVLIPESRDEEETFGERQQLSAQPATVNKVDEYNVMENAVNYNTPLSLDEYVEEINEDSSRDENVEVFLRDTNYTETSSSFEKNQPGSFSSSELMESFDSRTYDEFSDTGSSSFSSTTRSTTR